MSNRVGKLVFLVLLTLLVGVFHSSGQAQNVSGVTGLINIPTASVRARGSMNIAYNWFEEDHYASIILGVFPGVEVGLAGKLNDPDNSSGLIGNIKVKLLEETAKYPAVAVGLRADGEKMSYYIVGSMQIEVPGVRAHLGIGTGGSNTPFFAGISSVLNPVSISAVDKQFYIPLTTLSLELDGSTIHAGVLLKFKNQLEGRLTITNFTQIGLGVNYTYSF